MNDTNMAVLLVSMIGQWLTAAGSIWLTWWAAQSRDAVALRVVAMVLVIAPALLWPFVNFGIAMDGYGTVSSRAFLIGAIGVAIAVLRALFLAVWAIVSKDRAYLRIGGGVVALVLLVGIAIQALGTVMRL